MKHTIHSYCFWLLTLAAMLSVQSCTDQEEWQPATTGTEIQLFAYKPDDSPSTKAPDKTKENFNNRDIIHVTAAFTPIASQSSVSIPNQYACMKFDGNDWKATDNTSLVWPWNAKTGTFTAYYIPGTTSALKTGDSPLDLSTLSKSVITDGKDPLKATYSNIAVGSAVHLQFNHICSKLTFTSIETDVMKGQKIQISGGKVTKDLTFTLNEDSTLTAAFSNTASPVEGIVESNDGNKTLTFLLPPLATETELRMLHQDNSLYHSFTLPQALEAGKHYYLDIKKLADNYIDESLKEEDWNTGEETVTLDTDGINAYLTAIRDGKAYTLNDGTQILIQIQEGDNRVVAQIRDVDFNNQPFTPVNISGNIIFQGNNHRIKNVNITNTINENVTDKNTAPSDGDICLAIFGKNQGTIKNIVLDGVKANYPSTDADSKQPSYAGALVGKNIGGTIDNVKILFASENKMEVTTGSDKLYIGALVGYSTGTIKNCRVSGTATTISGTSTATTSTPKAFVGGFAGEIAGATSYCEIRGITAKATTNEAATANVGGFTGANSGAGTIKHCSCNTAVEVSGSTATESSIGGFIGLAEQGISYSTATGTIKAGSSTAGGFVGKAKNCKLDICSSTGEITVTGTTTTAGGFVGILSKDAGKDGVTIMNSFTLSQAETSATLTGGFVGNVESGTTSHAVNNSFCKNTNSSFAPTTGVTVDNCHNNGGKIGETVKVTVDELNTVCDNHADWLKWTATPAIYGDGFPYHIR